MNAPDLFNADATEDRAEALAAELQAQREAHPDDLVFRINRWKGPIGEGPPDETAVMVVKPGKREGRPPHMSMLLGIMAVFGADEMDVGLPVKKASSID